jgi:hypothetical protein
VRYFIRRPDGTVRNQRVAPEVALAVQQEMELFQALEEEEEEEEHVFIDLPEGYDPQTHLDEDR